MQRVVFQIEDNREKRVGTRSQIAASFASTAFVPLPFALAFGAGGSLECVFMHVYIYICTKLFTDQTMYICFHTYMYTYIYIYMCVCVNSCRYRFVRGAVSIVLCPKYDRFLCFCQNLPICLVPTVPWKKSPSLPWQLFLELLVDLRPVCQSSCETHSLLRSNRRY